MDVDGVIVGEKVGFNSPWPNKKVIGSLRKIKKSGVSISLITAKPHYSVSKIIKDAKLNNLHITDGGAVVVDPLNNKIAFEEDIDVKVSIQVIETLVGNNVYTEFYTISDYYIQTSQISDITNTHAQILQKEPVKVKSLTSKAKTCKITKIMPIVNNEFEKEKVEKILNSFKGVIKVSWGIHPIALPHLFGILTSPNVSKKISAMKLAKEISTPFSEILGIGDSTSDWQFMEMCGYVGIMGNSQDELKKLGTTKATDRYFIADSVDNNGVLDIFSNFKLDI